MIKAYSLQPYELEQVEALQREAQSATALYGSLAIQMEDAKDKMVQVQTKQRSLIELVAKRCEVPPNFISARIESNNLVAEFPDAQPFPVQTEQPPAPAQIVNGHDLSAAQ